MGVDMTKWQEIAKANVHNRPAGEGRLAGKITIVTGAAQGFGKGIAEELYAEGATIVVADMNLPLAETVAKEMGERAWAIAVNVSDEESCANMVAQVVEKFGGLDIMVANAGVVRSGPIASFEKKDFDFVTAINYTGLFLTCKYAAIIMQAQHEANPEEMYDIIAMSSKSGLEGSNKNFLSEGIKNSIPVTRNRGRRNTKTLRLFSKRRDRRKRRRNGRRKRKNAGYGKKKKN